MKVDLNYFAFSDRYLEIVTDVPDGNKGNLCQVQSPNFPDQEYNDGFLIQNLENKDIYMVVDKITKLHREAKEQFGMFIIPWMDFTKYFRVLDETEQKVLSEYQKKQWQEQSKEGEPLHWFMALCAFACFCVGGLLMASGLDAIDSSPFVFLLGLIMAGSAVAGTAVTSFWQEYDDLPNRNQIIALVPVIIGGFSILVIALLYLANSAKSGTSGSSNSES